MVIVYDQLKNDSEAEGEDSREEDSNDNEGPYEPPKPRRDLSFQVKQKAQPQMRPIQASWSRAITSCAVSRHRGSGFSRRSIGHSSEGREKD